VLVVADNIPKDPRQAYELLYDPNQPLLSPIGMNTQTFLKKLREGSTFILEILEDGRILCGDHNFIKEVMKLYREKRRQYIRKGKTWIKIK
jgi:hypothetical protein